MKNLKTRLRLIAFTFIVNTIPAVGPVFSQDLAIIEGKVVELMNSSPVMYANITLLKKEAVIQRTTTDQKGLFKFTKVAAGEYQISASMVGYVTKTLKSVKIGHGEKKKITLSLKVQHEKLSEVVIVEDEVESKSLMESVPMPGNVRSEKRHRMSSPSHNSINTLIADEYNTEEYDYEPENAFRDALRTPLSTFSIDVDVASYANTRRFLNSGKIPPPDAVRIEELINYFTYDYSEPTDEHPVKLNTELAACPWNKKHKLLKVGMQAKRISLQNLPPSNLTFLLDVSGSMMSPHKLPLLKKALGLLVKQMRPVDKVSIVVYAGAAGMVLPPTDGNNKEVVLKALDNLRAGGSTAGGAGIKLAYEVAQQGFKINGNNRVILATDGDFNVGVSSDGDLVRMIEEKRASGIYLTVLGFGTGNLKDSKMEQLADKGNGNYAYIDNIMEAKKVLVNEMGGTLFTVANDVKIQIEFNPSKVSAYKLIGYENRMLKARDFNDDKKDAGEIGSGHNVTALYEIVPVKVEDNNISIDPLKYQTSKVMASGNELLTLKVRYKHPGSVKSELFITTVKDNYARFESASEDFRFASSVAMFGLILRKSKFKGNANYKIASDIARDAKGMDKDGYRSEFIRLVDLAGELDDSRSIGNNN